MVTGLDTNFFIYLLQEHSKFGPEAKKALRIISQIGNSGITSIISLLELLSFNDEPSRLKTLQAGFAELPNLKTFNVNQEIALEAARIRRTYGFKTSDAIQLATALIAKADKFITNDQRLKKFKELKIQMLSSS